MGGLTSFFNPPGIAYSEKFPTSSTNKKGLSTIVSDSPFFTVGRALCGGRSDRLRRICPPFAALRTACFRLRIPRTARPAVPGGRSAGCFAVHPGGANHRFDQPGAIRVCSEIAEASKRRVQTNRFAEPMAKQNPVRIVPGREKECPEAKVFAELNAGSNFVRAMQKVGNGRKNATHFPSLSKLCRVWNRQPRSEGFRRAGWRDRTPSGLYRVGRQDSVVSPMPLAHVCGSCPAVGAHGPKRRA